MFESLSNRLQEIFDRLGQQGVLTEQVVDNAMREVRMALLEADVSLPAAKDFIKRVKERKSNGGSAEGAQAWSDGAEDRPRGIGSDAR
ncbi:MAG: signal recognition particle receptor subunit alpha [Anaerolineae bacterium]